MSGRALGLIYSLLAGSATAVGGASVFFLNDLKASTFSGCMALAAGVMIYVSFVEIIPESIEHLTTGLINWSSNATLMGKTFATGLFLMGWIFASIMEHLIHATMTTSETTIPAAQEIQSSSDLLTKVNDHNTKTHQNQSLIQTARATSTGHRLPPAGSRSGSRSPSPVSTSLSAFCLPSKYDDEETRLAELKFKKDNLKIIELGYVTALVLALHNFPEGIATYTGTAANQNFGAGVAIAIGIHNIPEGLAVAVPVFFGFQRKWPAFWLAVLSGAAEPLGALLASSFLGREPNATIMGIIFGLTAGIMVNVGIRELLRTAFRYDPGNAVSTKFMLLGMTIMAISMIALDAAGAHQHHH